MSVNSYDASRFITLQLQTVRTPTPFETVVSIFDMIRERDYFQAKRNSASIITMRHHTVNDFHYNEYVYKPLGTLFVKNNKAYLRGTGSNGNYDYMKLYRIDLY